MELLKLHDAQVVRVRTRHFSTGFPENRDLQQHSRRKMAAAEETRREFKTLTEKGASDDEMQ